MDSKENAADAILADYITRASRLVDRLCTGVPGVSDYFLAEDIAGEIVTNGVINYKGDISLYPHKPVITAVTALSYRYRLSQPWTAADITRVSLETDTVRAELNLLYAENIYVMLSYTGGLGKTLEDLPADFVDAATVLAVRLYKEARSGLGDSIGVAELGTLTYTKAFPLRVQETLENYARIAPWT